MVAMTVVGMETGEWVVMKVIVTEIHVQSVCRDRLVVTVSPILKSSYYLQNLYGDVVHVCILSGEG